MRAWLGPILCISIPLASACGATTKQLKKRAAFDLQCDVSNINIVKIDRRTMGVSGCGKRVTYIDSCIGATDGSSCTWVLNSDSERDRSAQSDDGASGRDRPAERGAAEVEISRKQDTAVIQVRIRLDERGTNLTLMALPGRDPDQVIAGLYHDASYDGCELQIMTGEGLLELPKTEHLAKGVTQAMRTQIPRDRFYRAASDDHVVVRACDDRWPLGPDALESMKSFALTLKEELAVLERARKDSN